MESGFDDELSVPTRLPRVTPRNSTAGAGEAIASASKETPYANVGRRLLFGLWKKADEMSCSSDSSQVSSRNHQHH